MSILHAKCEKEIAELEKQLKNNISDIKKKNNKEVKKLNEKIKDLEVNKNEVKKLNEKIKDLEVEIEEKRTSISTDSFLIKNNEKKIENYSKTIEKIVNIISPTDYKIIEIISSLDNKYTQIIDSEKLPELLVNLEIQESSGQLTMQAINGFINQISDVFSNVLIDIELEEIATSAQKTSLKFRTKYRSSYEDITSGIVQFCLTHFYVKSPSKTNIFSYDYNQARKPIILKSSKKDRLLEINLIPVN